MIIFNLKLLCQTFTNHSKCIISFKPNPYNDSRISYSYIHLVNGKKNKNTLEGKTLVQSINKDSKV